MMQANKILIAALMSCSLAGCGAMGANTSLYSVHQPVVERTNYAIDVNVGYDNGMDAGEQRRVTEWFDALNVSYGDRISIDYGNSGANPAFRQNIGRMAENYGLQLVETPPVTPGEVPSGTARIIVTRSKASVPSCPNHDSNHEANYNASVSTNYGCATNSNLAAMIADPEDLVRGQKSAPIDGNSGNAAINANRKKRAGDQP
jgi:pilus assembly protein CpaD